MKKNLLFFVLTLTLIGLFYIIAISEKCHISTLSFSKNNFTPLDRLETSYTPLKGKHLASIFFLQTFTDHILLQNPQIKDIHYSIRWPSTIHIRLEEKKEWAVCLTENKHHIISADGTLLNMFSSEEHIYNMDNLIIFRGIPTIEFQSGFLSKERLQKLQHIVRTTTQYIPEKKIQFEFHNQNQLILIQDDILPIKMGSIQQIERKVKQLQHYLSYTTTPVEQIQYIDLRVPNKVIVKYEHD